MALRSWSSGRRKKEGLRGRDHVLNSWDKAADIWINYFRNDEAKDRSKTWDKPIDIKKAPVQKIVYNELITIKYKRRQGKVNPLAL